MALTSDDKTWIKSAITDGIVDALNEIVIPRFDAHDKRFDEHDRRFDVIEADVVELKTDVAELKTDVAELKTDPAELKDDARNLKSDMREVKTTLSNLCDRVELLEADVKAVYYMIADMQKQQLSPKSFTKLPLEEKILKAYADIVLMAKEAGVSLPKS